MSNKDKQRKKCLNFEPQLFRRNLCKNCFKTEAAHNVSEDSPNHDVDKSPKPTKKDRSTRNYCPSESEKEEEEEETIRSERLSVERAKEEKERKPVKESDVTGYEINVPDDPQEAAGSSALSDTVFERPASDVDEVKKISVDHEDDGNSSSSSSSTTTAMFTLAMEPQDNGNRTSDSEEHGRDTRTQEAADQTQDVEVEDNVGCEFIVKLQDSDIQVDVTNVEEKSDNNDQQQQDDSTEVEAEETFTFVLNPSTNGSSSPDNKSENGVEEGKGQAIAFEHQVQQPEQPQEKDDQQQQQQQKLTEQSESKSKQDEVKNTSTEEENREVSAHDTESSNREEDFSSEETKISSQQTPHSLSRVEEGDHTAAAATPVFRPVETSSHNQQPGIIQTDEEQQASNKHQQQQPRSTCSSSSGGRDNSQDTPQIYEDIAVPHTQGGRYYAGRDEDKHNGNEDDVEDIYNIGPPASPTFIGTRILNNGNDLNNSSGGGDSYSSYNIIDNNNSYNSNNNSGHNNGSTEGNNNQQYYQYQDDDREGSNPPSPSAAAVEPVRRARGIRQIRRRSRSRDDTDFENTNRRLKTFAMDLDRPDAMMEGTRMLIDNLRDKLNETEQNYDKVSREKSSLHELLTLRKNENNELKDELSGQIHKLEDDVKRLQAENSRLVETLKMPESERSNLQGQEKEIATLRRKLEAADALYNEAVEDNEALRHEIRDLALEMDEMHDQFREEEALEFRELQKELEATAKNCRILQFKLRKSERRNEQMEGERMQYEDKLRQLEMRLEASDDKQHIRELEEELKMAKEVSVRLHDELELVEEKRARYEEELDRVNDILTESESRRRALQKEVESLNSEIEHLNKSMKVKKSSLKDTLEVPDTRAPKLGQKGKDSSVEYDIAQLMRDLSDSLERENDLKEQLKFTEEENVIMRKKLNDLEEENESLTMQLEKMSSAKSSKFFKKKSEMEKDVISEREHELRLQMELAEQELKVLRRKIDEMEEENHNLQKKVRGASQTRGSSAPREVLSEDRPYDEQLSEMAGDIDKLKQKLIEKDKQARKQQLSRSRSLEESGLTDVNFAEVKKQLEDKTRLLETEVEMLQKENDALKKVTQNIPAVKTDDSAMQNIDLKERVKKLEGDNSSLKERVKTLELQVNRWKKESDRNRERLETSNDAKELRSVREKLRTVERENFSLSKKSSTLSTQNDKLQAQLDKTKWKENKDAANELAKMSKDDLIDKVWYMEQEIKSLQRTIENREDENNRLEKDIEQSQKDMDYMFESIKSREKELLEELESMEQKYAVTSNLLELVTERADQTQKELEKYVREGSHRSTQSDVSAMSGVSAGEDEVFLSTSAEQRGETGIAVDWEKQFKKRIESLEALLAEEREKVQSVAKRCEKAESLKNKFEEESKMVKKEKDIGKQELTVCQKQLAAATEQVNDLKERLTQVQEAHKHTKEDKDKLMEELENFQKKKQEETEKEENTKKANMATWRWEKQELEKQVKDLKKSEENLHAELKRQQFKWKAAGEDIEKEQKQKLKMQEEVMELKKQNKEVSEESKQLNKKIKELEDSQKKQEATWERDRAILESDKDAAVKEVKEKDNTIKLKDSIIEQKDSMLQEKDVAVKERESQIKNIKSELKKANQELTQANRKIDTLQSKIDELEKKIKELQSGLKDKDNVIRRLNEDISKRDDRLKEKDDILQQLNRKLSEKENHVSDLDNTIRTTMQKLKDREAQIEQLQKETCEAVMKQKQQKDELKDKMDKLRKEQKDEVAAVNKDKDKIKSELDVKVKEHKALLSELQNVREDCKRKEDRYKKDKEKLEIEVKQLKEKVHSTRLSSTMAPGDVVKKLSGEKENLISDKHKMADEINQVRKELREAKRNWDKERDELEKIVREKSKMVDDTNAICDKLQDEMKMLKKQEDYSSEETTNGSKLTPISVIHEPGKYGRRSKFQTAVDKEPTPSADASKELHVQQEIFAAEKASLQEQYEGKYKNLQETVSQQDDQIKQLREENDKHLTLLQSSREALQDLRNRYDTGLTTWNEEKEHLASRAKKTDVQSDKISKLEQELQTIKSNLNEVSSKQKDAENKLASERVSWKAEKAALQSKLKKPGSTNGAVVDDAPTPSISTGRPRVNTSVSDFRSKFEKFGGPAKKAKSPPPLNTGGNALSDVNMVDKKVWEESQQLVKDLQKQVQEISKSKGSEVKEFEKKLKEQRLAWEREKRELKDRNVKLTKQADNLTSLEKSLVDLQYKMAAEKESWAIERTQCHRSLDETKKEQQEQKQKMTELIAEVKKLRALAPLLQDSSEKSSASATIVKVKGASVERDDPKRALSQPVQVFTQALGHITKLLGDLDKPVLRSRNRTNAPPSFRRSQSMSEVEINPSKETFVFAPQSSCPAPSPTVVKPVQPSILTSAASLGRPSYIRRSLSTQESSNKYSSSHNITYAGSSSSGYASSSYTNTKSSGDFDYETATVDRRSYMRSSARGAKSSQKRSSFYQSGTQSAYGSRDTSPERTLSGIKRSPYPAAPPSMIISPSMTPRRAPSVEKDVNALTERDMRRLYDKLGEIDGQEDTKAIVEERGLGVRVLVKSVSVDTPNDDDAAGAALLSSLDSPHVMGEQSPYKKTTPTYGSVAKMHSNLFEDAPLSQTMLGTIQIGQLSITPGTKSFSNTKRQTARKRADSVSPKTARKMFYDNYPKERKGIPIHSGRKMQRQDSESDWEEPISVKAAAVHSSTRYDSDMEGMTPYASRYEDSDVEASGPSRSRYDSDMEDLETKTSSKFSASGFLKNVKSKRRLFGSKRSMSVETSAVGSTTMMAGVQALSPAAPTGFQPPTDDEMTHEERKKHKKKKDKKSKEEKEQRAESRERKLREEERKERKSREEKEKKKKKKEKEREKEEKKEKKDRKKRSASVDVIARLRLGGGGVS